MSWEFGDIEIVVKYKDYEAKYYKDYFLEVDDEATFYNLEIYKDKKCLRHATFDKELTESYILEYLKSYVDEIEK